jgi:hypothetical protein
MSLDGGVVGYKAENLFLGFFFLWSRSWRRSRGRRGFHLALSLRFATATAARRTTARAAAVVVTATTAAFATAAIATAAHRPTAEAATTMMRENTAEAATERTAVASAARVTAAVAARSTSVAATAATVASKPESLGAAGEGQHGHDQSNTLKVHLTISIRVRVCKPMTSAVWRTPSHPDAGQT